MEIKSNSSRFIRSQMGMDHTIHTASITKALVEAIAEDLRNKTGVDAVVGSMTQSSGEDGAKYSITITHEAPVEWGDAKKQKVKNAHNNLQGQFSSKAGVLSMLSSKGII